MKLIDLPVARWGNGLAVRINAQVARELNVSEGSVLQAEVVGPARLRLGAAQAFDRNAFLAKLDELRSRMPVTEPVVEQMRKEARY